MAMQSGYPSMQQPGYLRLQPNDPAMMAIQPSYPMHPNGLTMPTNYPIQPGAPVPIVQQLNAPITVVGPEFVLPYATSLTMKGKNFLKVTSGNFEIHDSNDNLVLKVKGTFSLGSRRIIVDAQDNPIMTIKKKLMTVHNRWIAYKGDSTNLDNKIFSIKQSSLIQFKDNYSVYLCGNTTENVPDFRVKGSFIDRSCMIYLGSSDVLIARMDEKYNAKTILLGKDIFGITVQPNVDYIFIIACIIVVHEIDKATKDDDSTSLKSVVVISNFC